MPQVEWPGIGVIDAPEGVDLNRVHGAAKKYVMGGPSNKDTAGMVQPSTILNLYNRPVTKSPAGPKGISSGNWSTTYSKTFTKEDDPRLEKYLKQYGKDAAVLLPTVVNGKFITDKEAIDRLVKTGEHLGVFKNWQSAEPYATAIHNSQMLEGNYYGRFTDGTKQRTPIYQQQPSQYMPDVFPKAQQDVSQVVSEMPKEAKLPEAKDEKEVGANTGEGNIYLLSPENRFDKYEPNPYFVQSMNQTAGHESAHTAWTELSDEQQKAWGKIHKKDTSVASPRYQSDPAHAFADAYGYFVSDGDMMKKNYPDAYKFMTDASGMEYARPGSMDNPN